MGFQAKCLKKMLCALDHEPRLRAELNCIVFQSGSNLYKIRKLSLQIKNETLLGKKKNQWDIKKNKRKRRDCTVVAEVQSELDENEILFALQHCISYNWANLTLLCVAASRPNLIGPSEVDWKSPSKCCLFFKKFKKLSQINLVIQRNNLSMTATEVQHKDADPRPSTHHNPSSECMS